jgi:hypothetical protein
MAKTHTTVRTRQLSDEQLDVLREQIAPDVVEEADE